MREDRKYGTGNLSLDDIHNVNGVVGALTSLDLCKHIRELMAENAALKADAELHIATQRAGDELPEEWEINILIVNGFGYVMLCEPEGNSVDFPDDCESLARSVNDAVDFAIHEATP
jgi:hypothetical protein